MPLHDRIVIYGSFTSSSSYKPILFLALARLPFSFRTVNLKTGAQHLPGHLAINRYAQVPVFQDVNEAQLVPRTRVIVGLSKVF